MENSVTVLWDVQPKFFQYIYCQGTVEVSLALDTVRFPLIADRRSVCGTEGETNYNNNNKQLKI